MDADGNPDPHVIADLQNVKIPLPARSWTDETLDVDDPKWANPRYAIGTYSEKDPSKPIEESYKGRSFRADVENGQWYVSDDETGEHEWTDEDTRRSLPESIRVFHVADDAPPLAEAVIDASDSGLNPEGQYPESWNESEYAKEHGLTEGAPIQATPGDAPVFYPGEGGVEPHVSANIQQEVNRAERQVEAEERHIQHLVRPTFPKR